MDSVKQEEEFCDSNIKYEEEVLQSMLENCLDQCNSVSTLKTSESIEKMRNSILADFNIDNETASASTALDNIQITVVKSEVDDAFDDKTTASLEDDVVMVKSEPEVKHEEEIVDRIEVESCSNVIAEDSDDFDESLGLKRSFKNLADDITSSFSEKKQKRIRLKIYRLLIDKEIELTQKEGVV